MTESKVKYKGGLGKQFAYTPCPTCGRWISNCGFAYTKHNEMHKRNRSKKGTALISY